MNNIALETPMNTTIDLIIDGSEHASLDEKDAAWVSIKTPLHEDALLVFIHDVERFFRINPMLEFKQWQALGASSYFMSGRNISQKTPFEFSTKLHVFQKNNGFEIEYENGLKSHTLIEIEAITLENGKLGSRLTITDSYRELDSDNTLDEVDKSLVNWAAGLQCYFVNWRRWSGIKLWRWYMQRVWLPMKPNTRRITSMILWISVAEVALVALGTAVYFA